MTNLMLRFMRSVRNAKRHPLKSKYPHIVKRALEGLDPNPEKLHCNEASILKLCYKKALRNANWLPPMKTLAADAQNVWKILKTLNSASPQLLFLLGNDFCVSLWKKPERP